MAATEIRETIPASAEAVFALIHNYDRRLEWDTLLQEAYLEPEYPEACLGAISVCHGRSVLGMFALRTQYVSFDPGRVAAVKMLNQPPFFDTFAASIRHANIDDAHSEVIYKLNFTARPAWLRPILHPLMHAAFAWETRKRLRALKTFFGKLGQNPVAIAPDYL